MDFLSLMNEFVSQCKAIKECEARLNGLKKNRAEMERALILEFAKHGLQNMRVGGGTVYKARGLRVNKKTEVSMQEVCEILRDAGAGDLVAEAYQPAALKAYVKEKREQGDFAGPLAMALDVVEYDELRLIGV